jgi:hypothetical protein
MASAVTYSNLSPVLATLFEDDVQEQLNRAGVLFKALPKRDSFSRNINVAVRATSGLVASTGIYLAPGADVTTFNTDVKSNAHLEHATVSEAFSIDNFAYHAAAVTRNPLALADVVREEITTAAQRLFSNMNKELYTGNGGVVSSAQTMQGLMGAGATGTTGWLSTSNTSLAGIDQTAIASWQSNVLLNGGTPRAISFALLESMETAVYKASGQGIQMYVTGPTQWAKIAALFTATTTQFKDVATDSDMVYDVGSSNLKYRGVPIIKDKDCPDGYVLGLTPEHISLQQMPFAGIPTSNLDHADMELVAGVESQFGGGNVPFRVRIQELARSGDYTKMHLVAYPQLVVRRPNAQCLLGDLS